MSVKFSMALRTARANQIVSAIDAGAAAGTIKFYTGVQPAAVGGALSGNTLLGTLTFADPCATVTDGVLTFAAVTGDNSADADGTATWARLADSDGTTVMDLGVGAIGSGSPIEITSTNVVAGGPINITAGTITEG